MDCTPCRPGARAADSHGLGLGQGVGQRLLQEHVLARPAPRWRSRRAESPGRRCPRCGCRRGQGPSASPWRTPPSRTWPRPGHARRVTADQDSLLKRRDIEEAGDVPPGVRVGLAHKSVADHGHAERARTGVDSWGCMVQVLESGGRGVPVLREGRRPWGGAFDSDEVPGLHRLGDRDHGVQHVVGQAALARCGTPARMARAMSSTPMPRPGSTRWLGGRSSLRRLPAKRTSPAKWFGSGREMVASVPVISTKPIRCRGDSKLKMLWADWPPSN